MKLNEGNDCGLNSLEIANKELDSICCYAKHFDYYCGKDIPNCGIICPNGGKL